MLSTALVSLIPLLVASSVQAKNDWSVPCISGTCSYDLPGQASGTLKVWGGIDALTDITQAADWEILDCDPKAGAQNIRLVCKNDPEETTSKCGHLYQNIGAVNKLVRLPESCGPMAFARIAKAWVPEDQSIPESIQKRLVRRSGNPPIVKALRIDTNFEEVQWSKTGMVNFAIQGANVPGIDMSSFKTGSQARRSTERAFKPTHAPFARGHHHREIARGFFDNPIGAIKDAAGAIGDAAKNAAEEAKKTAERIADETKKAAEKAAEETKKAAEKAAEEAKKVAEDAKRVAEEQAKKVAEEAKKAAEDAKKAAEAVKDGATKAGDAAKTVATQVVGEIKDAAGVVIDAAKAVANQTITLDKGFDLPALTFSKQVNLLNSNLQCFGQSLAINVNLDANANMQAKLSVVAEGTVIPPGIKQFSVIAVMKGGLGATVDMTADISGTLASPLISLFTVGVPGLVFPGFLEIGPTFTVDAQLSGVVDLTMDMQVGMAVDLNDVVIAFPPDAKRAPQENQLSLGDAPLSLSATPNIQATGTITALVRPALNLGISALGGKGQAEVFLALDATADLTLDLAASAAIQKDKNGGAAPPSIDGTGINNAAAPAGDAAVEGEVTEGETVEGEATEEEVTEGETVAGEEEVTEEGTAEETVDETGAEGVEGEATEAEVPDPAAINNAAAPKAADAPKADAPKADAPKADAAKAAAPAPSAAAPAAGNSIAELIAAQEKKKTVTADCASDADCQQGCCGFTTGKCAGPAVAQSNGAGGCGRGTAAPNCNVATLLGFGGGCIAGFKNTDTNDRTVQAATAFSAKINNIPFTPTLAAAPAPPAPAAPAPADAAAAEGTEEEEVTEEEVTEEEVAEGEVTEEEVTEDQAALEARQDPAPPADNAAAPAGDAPAATFGGCVNIAANLDVNVGADGSFFGLFNKVISKSLFTKNFQLFRKCFGDQAGQENAAPPPARRSINMSTLERRIDFACPIGGLPTGIRSKSGVTKGTVKGKEVKSTSKTNI
ncbi:hypothetical protein MIND_00284900 [Mycena indigotica]|uniref:Uncharacterized protein n=1 Tax=Mycena indigotica TaxID=2126181 RepID=A0A8H6TA16_9AGAR|nr:uncharacterized protein MIND_00284900 [Mycena indigotica]KAF7312702.1 hypothetical protein MIND_00284900 [Mycena indigotica]